MSESQLQKAVLELAKRLGYRCAHFRAAQVRPGKFVTAGAAETAGFPDLVMTRGDRLLFVELKAEGGYRKPRQREWHAALEAAGQTVYTWKPKDWRSGAIEAALA